MEFPQITTWDDKRIEIPEKMKILKSFRFFKEGKLIKYKPGDEDNFKGNIKKDLYHQLKICYPTDEQALNQFFETQRKAGRGIEYRTPPNIAKASDVDILKGQVAQLTQLIEDQKETIKKLSEKKSGGK